MTRHVRMIALLSVFMPGCTAPQSQTATSAQPAEGAPIQIVASVAGDPPPGGPGIVQQEFARVATDGGAGRGARLNPRVFQKGRRVRFRLFGDDVDAVVTSTTIRGDDDRSFTASTERRSDSVFVTYAAGQLAASLRLPDEGDIEIKQFDADRLLVTRYEPKQDLRCSVFRTGTVNRPAAHTMSTQTSQVDVGALYTPEAVCGGAAECQETEQNLLNRIGNWFDDANRDFHNSKTNVTLNLVAREKLQYHDSGIPAKDLDALNALEREPGASVLAFRKRTRADVVVLFIAKTSRDYGVANLFDVPDPKLFAPCATAVVTVMHAYNSRTLAHEIGHTMGAGHQAGREGGRFPYSRGNLIPFSGSTRYTNMAVGDQGYRFGLFSSPNVYVPDSSRPTGHEAADNVRTLNETREAVASFQPGMTEPSPHACESLRVLAIRAPS